MRIQYNYGVTTPFQFLYNEISSNCFEIPYLAGIDQIGQRYKHLNLLFTKIS